MSNKIAMVAAGSKGIGLAIAQKLTLDGHRVSICSRNRENLNAAQGLIGESVHGFVADVNQANDLANWHSEVSVQLGPPQIVVTNTGGPPVGRVEDLSDEDWQQGFDTTILMANRLSRLAVPVMRRLNWGRIVHITSLVAREPNPILTISSTLRAGMMALTLLQAREWAVDGITVNSVLPGHTLTDRQLHLAQIRAGLEQSSVDEVLAQQSREIPVQRLGNPEEIASVVAFLCQEETAFLTGQSILVDGGNVRCHG